MGPLAIGLESGFDDDHVVVEIDDRTVLDDAHVSTRYQVGFARMLEVPTDAAEVRVGVRLPSRRVAGETTVQVAECPTLRVSVENGEVVFSAGDTPLYYA